MSRRPALHDLRRWILEELDDEWRSPSELQRALYLGGHEFYRVALICERLAHQGAAELQNPRSNGKRYFRRAA